MRCEHEWNREGVCVKCHVDAFDLVDHQPGVYRCEDFPCCGHKLGECEDRPELTKEYWVDQYMNDPDF